MGYQKKTFSVSLIMSVMILAGLIYLVVSSMVALSLLPAVGVGGMYGQVGTIQGDIGTVYPEYQGDGTGFVDEDEPEPPFEDQEGRFEYEVPITTSVPGCTGPEGEDGIPMLVIELDGEARAADFELRKDIRIPFLEERWMVIEISDPPITLSGDNLKIFTTQFAGQFLEVRNARIIEGGIDNPDFGSGENWGPDSSQFVIQGGQDAGGGDQNPPGLFGQGIEAWVHGATGERVTLETPPQASLNLDISYESRNQVEAFYTGEATGEEAKLGFGLEDQNIDFRNTFDDDDERVQRGFDDFGDDAGYFPCSDLGEITG